MVHIIPWSVRKGFTTLTEKGVYEGDTSYITFLQKILTGIDSIVVCWSGSTDLIKPKRETDTKDKEDPIYWTNNFYRYDFHKGYYYLGTPISGGCSRRVEFEDSKVNSDMLAMKSNNEWTIRFNFLPSDLINNNVAFKKVNSAAKWFKLNDKIVSHSQMMQQLEEQCELSHAFLPRRNDMYRFYTIPELNENEWLYISNVEYLFEDETEKISACEITFSSVSDLIQTSGKAQEQYIQCGAIGEPYCFPQIKKDDNNKTYLDYQIVEPQRARWLQCDFQGPCAISDIIVMGREIYKDEDGNWCTKAPKQLLFNRTAEPHINDFNKNSLPAKNYYMFHNSRFFYEITKEWVDAWKQIDNVVAQNSYSSFLTLGEKSEWDKDNPFIHKSNPIVDAASGTHYTYLDANWHPISLLELQNITLNNLGSPYCSNNITYWKEDNMVQIMNKNTFAFGTQEVLPISWYSTCPYKLSNLPIIGGFFAKLLGDWTLFPNERRLNAFPLILFMPCDVGTLMKSIYNVFLTSDAVNIKGYIGLLNGKEDAPKSLGLNSTMASILGELTDKVKIVYDNKYEVVDTELLGQKRYPNGEFIRENGEKLVFADTAENRAFTQFSENSFVIDCIITQAVFNGDIRITAYSGTNAEKPLWASTVCSNTKWRQDSYVDWTSIIYTGGWEDIWTIREDEMTWPESPDMEITQPHINVDLQVNEKSMGLSAANGIPQPQIVSNWKWNGTYTSSYYENLSLNERIFYNNNTKAIYINYKDFDSTIETKQDFIDKYAGKTLQIQIEGAISEHHHDIFYDADFGTQTPSYYEIHLDENGEVIEGGVKVFGKNTSDALTNFIPYETDTYFTAKHLLVSDSGDNDYTFNARHIAWFEPTITFELFSDELLVNINIKDCLYFGHINGLPPTSTTTYSNLYFWCANGIGRNAQMNSFYLKIKNIIFSED